MRQRTPRGVLVVEDDFVIRDTLLALLKSEGYLVAGAADGREALEQLQSGTELPSLILLDLMMPIMTGWEFCDEIKRQPELAGIPIAIMSAHDRARDTIRRIDVDVWLGKPLDIGTLLRALERYCF